MDPLSQLLALLEPQRYVSVGVILTPEMSVQWPAHDGVKCYAVVAGACWLTVDGVAEPLRLNAGECYLLPPGAPFRLATNPDAQTVDFQTVRSEMVAVTAAKLDETSACLLVGGHFLLTGRPAQMLLGTLPPVVHIRRSADRAAMQWALERMSQEVREAQPGSVLIVQQLAFMLLIQALRLYANDPQQSGWLAALKDKKLGAALTCMHQHPEHKWTLAELAARVGMSRAVFAERFKQTVGIAPVDYLTQWRMHLACDQLKKGNGGLTAIAAGLGYESESAFAKAFKRVIGVSPGKFSKENA
ncbi:AraC family transcriptional regulator [Pantoea stewartii]|uniref:AraC family transcriptional regulator n=1 Tax=Pantoea stewartii TaxID=66269 RepID=UPI00197CDEB1|nr:AraC family transcriptional regulator [Pantoea stewartii]